MSDTRDRNLERKSPDELEHDIEETRARIRDEMGALGYKLGPEGLRDSAEDALDDTQQAVVSVTEQLRKGVVESSGSIGGRLSAFIKQNPVPATLFGIGLAWLLKQGQESQGYARGYQGGRDNSASRSRGDRSRTEAGSRSSSTPSRTEDDTIVANAARRSSTGGSRQGARRYERSDAASGTSSEDEAFRSHFESNFSSNGDYDDYEPAYRYGFDLAREDEFSGKPWSDARGDIKRRWDEERNEPWFRYDSAVEHGYTTAQSRR